MYCELIPKRLLEEDGKTKWIPTDKENIVEIRDANSKTMKSIQLTDLLVGCAREHYARGIDEYFPIVKGLFKKDRMRIQTTDYVYAHSERGFLSPKRLKKW